jgi:hypothetical protein
LLMWSALSEDRTVCRLQLVVLALVSAVILGPESCGIHANTLLSQIRDSPNQTGQVPVFISTRNTVIQLQPRHGSHRKLLTVP